LFWEDIEIQVTHEIPIWGCAQVPLRLDKLRLAANNNKWISSVLLKDSIMHQLH